MLVALRDDLHAPDAALVLVLVVLGAAIVGGRGLEVLAAIVSAASFDFFCTRPYSSFTIAHRWNYGLVVNGIGAVLSLVVDIIIAITKFTHGAWFIIVAVPVMVAALVRPNRQYEAEVEGLEHDAPCAAEAPILRRHAVIVLVDRLDAASAPAMQYVRTLNADELRAVHFDLDPIKTEDLSTAWRKLGLSRLPLDIVECRDRRISRAAAEVVSVALLDGETEVSVLIPQREYAHFWHRFLHDRTADSDLGGVRRCSRTPT